MQTQEGTECTGIFFLLHCISKSISWSTIKFDHNAKAQLSDSRHPFPFMVEAYLIVASVPKQCQRVYLPPRLNMHVLPLRSNWA